MPLYQIKCYSCEQQTILREHHTFHTRPRTGTPHPPKLLGNKHTLTCQKIAFKGISIRIISRENDPANLRLFEAFRHIRNTSLLSTLDRNAANSRIAIPKHYLRSLTVYLGFRVIPTLLARFPKYKHFAEYSFYP